MSGLVVYIMLGLFLSIGVGLPFDYREHSKPRSGLQQVKENLNVEDLDFNSYKGLPLTKKESKDELEEFNHHSKIEAAYGQDDQTDGEFDDAYLVEKLNYGKKIKGAADSLVELPQQRRANILSNVEKEFADDLEKKYQEKENGDKMSPHGMLGDSVASTNTTTSSSPTNTTTSSSPQQYHQSKPLPRPGRKRGLYGHFSQEPEILQRNP